MFHTHSIFTQLRTFVLFFILACAVVVLGLSASFASKLLPYDSDFIIFAVAVSTATVMCTSAALLRSTPFMDAFGMFVFSVLWVAMGGFTVDRIGGERCVDLLGQKLNTGRDRTMSAYTYCVQLKVVMAFSWAEFATILLMFLIVLALTIRARTHGAGSMVWNESISDLPWFGNWVGEDRQHYRPTYPMPSYLQPYSPSLGGGRPPSRIVIQAPPPGESVFLRPEDGYQPAPVPMGSYRQ